MTILHGLGMALMYGASVGAVTRVYGELVEKSGYVDRNSFLWPSENFWIIAAGQTAIVSAVIPRYKLPASLLSLTLPWFMTHPDFSQGVVDRLREQKLSGTFRTQDVFVDLGEDVTEEPEVVKCGDKKCTGPCGTNKGTPV